jgi:hypothetical protein
MATRSGEPTVQLRGPPGLHRFVGDENSYGWMKICWVRAEGKFGERGLVYLYAEVFCDMANPWSHHARERNSTRAVGARCVVDLGRAGAERRQRVVGNVVLDIAVENSDAVHTQAEQGGDQLALQCAAFALQELSVHKRCRVRVVAAIGQIEKLALLAPRSDVVRFSQHGSERQ